MMSNSTGYSLTQKEHIQQSIRTILFTPIGSRVMRRNFGSLIFKLLDQPFNDAVCLQVMAASATAIMTWEPRVNLKSAIFTQVSNGKFSISLTTQLVGSDESFDLNIPLQYGASV